MRKYKLSERWGSRGAKVVEADLVETLSRYRGGKIRRGRHPVWLAVVAVERYHMRAIATASTPQPYKLVPLLARVWFTLLAASRSGLKAEAKAGATLLRAMLVMKRSGEIAFDADGRLPSSSAVMSVEKFLAVSGMVDDYVAPTRAKLRDVYGETD